MNIIVKLISIVLHLDRYLGLLMQTYGEWTYILIFIIVFCETGLVVTPFLPGDSILFATGALAAEGIMKLSWLFIVFYAAAVIGDTVNYHIGKKVGKSIYGNQNIKFINKKNLVKAHHFYEKHGSMTIVIGRFIPVIRTFVPFVAGIGEMRYSRFILFNMLGGLMWVILFLFGGFFFGNLPIVKNNFSFVLLAIIVISLLPGIFVFLKERASHEDEA